MKEHTDWLAQSDNPYLQSRAMWNDLYGDVQTRLENAYRIILLLAVVIVIAIIGMVTMASQSRVQPYLTVLHGNEMLTVHDAHSSDFHTLKPLLAQMQAKQFIRQARSYSVDAQVNRQQLINAYSHALGPAVSWLKSQVRESHSSLTQVFIETVLLKSDKTLDIRWREQTLHRKTGEVITTQHYSAELTYRFQPEQADSELSEQNPLGFFITHVVMSKDHGITQERA